MSRSRTRLSANVVNTHVVRRDFAACQSPFASSTLAQRLDQTNICESQSISHLMPNYKEPLASQVAVSAIEVRVSFAHPKAQAPVCKLSTKSVF